MQVKSALRFAFCGYSVWLEPVADECCDDLENAIKIASQELGIQLPIPAAHATVVYGISHLSEQQVLRRFRQAVMRIPSWPCLPCKGFFTGVEWAGIDGGTMDMAWMEITYQTSPEHEKLLDLLYDSFHWDSSEPARQGPWSPHISLAYDNPERPMTSDYLTSIVQRFPTLQQPRKFQAISLWKTKGTIDQWKCLERIPLLPDECDPAQEEDMESYMS